MLRAGTYWVRSTSAVVEPTVCSYILEVGSLIDGISRIVVLVPGVDCCVLIGWSFVEIAEARTRCVRDANVGERALVDCLLRAVGET